MDKEHISIKFWTSQKCYIANIHCAYRKSARCETYTVRILRHIEFDYKIYDDWSQCTASGLYPILTETWYNNAAFNGVLQLMYNNFAKTVLTNRCPVKAKTLLDLNYYNLFLRSLQRNSTNNRRAAGSTRNRNSTKFYRHHTRSAIICCVFANSK